MTLTTSCEPLQKMAENDEKSETPEGTVPVGQRIVAIGAGKILGSQEFVMKEIWAHGECFARGACARVVRVGESLELRAWRLEGQGMRNEE